MILFPNPIRLSKNDCSCPRLYDYDKKNRQNNNNMGGQYYVLSHRPSVGGVQLLFEPIFSEFVISDIMVDDAPRQ